MELQELLSKHGFVDTGGGPDEGLEQRYVWQNGIEIGKYRVLFGYRLRAGYIGRYSYELDICCGALSKHYEDMLLKIVTIMV